MLDSAAIDDLIKQGKLLPGRTDFARTGIGIAVKKGAPKPDVSSPERFNARCSRPNGRTHRAGRRRHHRDAL